MQGRSGDDGAEAAQRRADAAVANTERNRHLLRPSPPDDRPDDGLADRPWSALPCAQDGTAQARDRAARMHDNAASMHDEAVRLGIGDSEDHRRIAARHREAATSHRPSSRRSAAVEGSATGPQPPDDAA